MVDVSIILVNYNTRGLLKQCILSILNMTKGINIEIIVSDNDSTDGSAEMIKIEFPTVILIENKANLGFGRANNIGISFAKGKYLLLLNTDTYFLNDAISIFFDYMENPAHQDVACCGGDLFKPDGARQASYGNFPSIFDAISQLGFYRLYPVYYKRYIAAGALNYDNSIKKVDFICGADMFLRRSMMDRVGYFDEDFFLYFEETEMSYRIKKSGLMSMLIPEAKIVHLEGGSQDGAYLNLRRIKQFSKSRRLYFKKSHSNFSSSIVTCIFSFQALLFYLFKRNPDYLKVAKTILNS